VELWGTEGNFHLEMLLLAAAEDIGDILETSESFLARILECNMR
jgi:hypothetical protein